MLESIVKAYAPFVTWCAQKHATPQMPAPDLIPEGNYALVQAYRSFETDVKGAIRRAIRRAAHRPDITNADAHVCNAAQPDTSRCDNIRSYVQNALAALPDDERRVAELVLMDGQTHDAAAERLKISADRVRQLKEAAEMKLKNFLEEDEAIWLSSARLGRVESKPHSGAA